MRFVETRLKGAYLIEPEIRADERGFFARAFCRREFEAHGLNPDLVQCNLSYNNTVGTVRGMHYQRAPHAEAKLVRCTAGAICDVILDLRPDSPTFAQWAAVELSAGNRRLLYVPEGFAHGYQTLLEGAEVFYQVSAFYHPQSEGGARWDDPTFKIEWPLPVNSISAKDASYPDWGTSP
jgi:dTDP-4-dehydrorhamnose 3,5-epimerase